jgi:hypothetical protein
MRPCGQVWRWRRALCWGTKRERTNLAPAACCEAITLLLASHERKKGVGIMLGTLFVAVLLTVVGLLTGWGIPLAAKSSRPYGLMGDVVASALTMLVAGVAEWAFILPALGSKGWMALAIAVGDPWFLALIVLWLMRRVKS